MAEQTNLRKGHISSLKLHAAIRIPGQLTYVLQRSSEYILTLLLQSLSSHRLLSLRFPCGWLTLPDFWLYRKVMQPQTVMLHVGYSQLLFAPSLKYRYTFSLLFTSFFPSQSSAVHVNLFCHCCLLRISLKISDPAKKKRRKLKCHPQCLPG